MSKKLGQQEVEEQLNNAGVKYLPFVYKSMRQEIEYYCSKCNNISIRDIASLVRGRTKCPNCSGNVKYTQQQIEQKLNDLKIIFKSFEYTGMHQIIEYQCPDCGTWKEGQIVHIFNGHASCKVCSGKAKRTQTEAELLLRKLNIKYKTFIYENNETHIESQCPDCGAWKISRFIDLINGHIRCSECAIKKVNQEQILTQEEAERRLNLLKLDYKPFVYDKRKTTQIEIKCTNCGEYFDAHFSYLIGKGSTLCNRCKKCTSLQENELKDYIKSFNINIEENKKINGVEIDIFIPEKNIAFEYNGNWWHSDFNKETNFHYNKISHLQENNIRLIMINEYEWINNNMEIKSFIKSQLGLIENRIYGRDCKVREVEYKDCESLLNYHQQKQVVASKYLGLYFNNEIVLCMLFNKHVDNKNGEWEVKREVCKEGYSIVGGKSKVFNYFVKTYNPTSVFTFVDRSKFTGNSYKIMGFELDHIVPARYDWIVNGKFVKRQPSRYKEMIKLYEDKKALRFWDSGRYCYIWNKKKPE
jgi:formylmethanofuran dehydrogenase subunit E